MIIPSEITTSQREVAGEVVIDTRQPKGGGGGGHGGSHSGHGGTGHGGTGGKSGCLCPRLLRLTYCCIGGKSTRITGPGGASFRVQSGGGGGGKTTTIKSGTFKGRSQGGGTRNQVAGTK